MGYMLMQHRKSKSHKRKDEPILSHKKLFNDYNGKRHHKNKGKCLLGESICNEYNEGSITFVNIKEFLQIDMIERK